MFSYVNELNDELESLNSRIDQLTIAIQEAQTINDRISSEQTQTLEQLKTELEQQTALADAAEENLAQVIFH